MSQLPAIIDQDQIAAADRAHVVPSLIATAGERATFRSIGFFAANIRNPHTRRAYPAGRTGRTYRPMGAKWRADPALNTRPVGRRTYDRPVSASQCTSRASCSSLICAAPSIIASAYGSFPSRIS